MNKFFKMAIRNLFGENRRIVAKSLYFKEI